MKLKNNFQRNLIMALFTILNSLILGIIFFICIYCFKLSLWAILLLGILFSSSFILIIFIESQLFFIISIIFATYSSFVCTSFFTVSKSLYAASILYNMLKRVLFTCSSNCFVSKTFSNSLF